MNEHGMLQHLIQRKGQHRVYNGPPNHMRLRGPDYGGNTIALLTATSGSPSSPHRPLRKVCHDLRNLSSTRGNCINLSYLHRSPISKHFVLIFNPENTSLPSIPPPKVKCQKHKDTPSFGRSGWLPYVITCFFPIPR